MTRLKTTTCLSGAVTLALSLAACGGGEESEYCELISGAEAEYANLSGADPTDTGLMAELSGTFSNIADAAPSSISADWQTAADGWQALTEIDTSDPEAIDRGDFADMEEALQNVSGHVRQECDIDLTES